MEQIRDWAVLCPRPRIVVIDGFERLLPYTHLFGMRIGKDSDRMYKLISALRGFAMEEELTVMLLYNTPDTAKNRRAGPFAPIDSIRAYASIPDAHYVLRKSANEAADARLYIRGHDIEEFDVPLAKQNRAWRVLDDETYKANSTARENVLRVMQEHQEKVDATKEAGEHMPPGMTAPQIAEQTGQEANSVRSLLRRMKGSGDVKLIRRGKYGLA